MLVTLGHLNKRLGSTDAFEPGPFLAKNRDDETTGFGTITIKRHATKATGVGGAFIIRGINDSNVDIAVLEVVKHDDGDYIRVNSAAKNLSASDNYVMNSAQIYDELDKKVNISGDTMSGTLYLTGQKYLDNYDRNDHPNTAATKQYVLEAPMGTVHHGRTDVEGQLWAPSGASRDLYYNPYTS